MIDIQCGTCVNINLEGLDKFGLTCRANGTNVKLKIYQEFSEGGYNKAKKVFIDSIKLYAETINADTENNKYLGAIKKVAELVEDIMNTVDYLSLYLTEDTTTIKFEILFYEQDDNGIRYSKPIDISMLEF